MKNKGFTLVELLTVLVIISLLMTIAVPSSIMISNKIKQKLLKSKINLAEQAAVLWAQDHKNCFTSSCTELSSTDCSIDPTDNSKKICNIKIELLANDNYFDYDEGNKILSPVDNELCLNKYIIVITYNTKTKAFAATLSTLDHNATCPTE